MPDQTPQIRPRQIDALIPYVRNARTHSDEQVALIAASLVEFGWTNPVLVDGEAGIIAGHGRVMAARKVADSGATIPNWPDASQVPTIELAHLTPAQKRAYVLADNQLATRAGWDVDMLRVELGDLKDDGFDLSLTGFSDTDLAGLLDTRAEGLTDPDDTPAVPANPVTVLGDVWLLGRHRIACGDCTDPLVVDKALNGVKPHLMVTDPPYGVQYDAAWRGKAGVGSSGAAVGKVMNDDRADWREAWSLFPGDVGYVWHAGTFAGDVASSLLATKFKIRAQIVWVKTRHVLSRGDYHHQHEPAYYAVRDGADEQWNFVPEHEIASYAVRNGAVGHYVGGRKQSTVWFIEHIKSDTGHSTQKPVECMKRPIENNSSPGQAVYEPFSGSGTTIIAAEMTGRACHAIELSPAYVDVAVKRWQDFTGQKATLESTGETFDEVAAKRVTELEPA